MPETQISSNFRPYSLYETELKKINSVPQAQFSTDEQLYILREFANKLGLYDAADILKNL